MARVDYPELDSAEAQRVAERIKQERGGRLLNLFRMQLHNPAIAEAWLSLGTAVRFKSALDAATRELAICEVASLCGAEYEWRAHRRIAASEGVTDQQLDTLPNWQAAETLFDHKQRAVLALAQKLTESVEVDDPTFDAAREYLPPRQLVELVVTVGYYNMVSRFLVGLQIDLE
jgi:alkylhydroperoxidase family enzyme